MKLVWRLLILSVTLLKHVLMKRLLNRNRIFNGNYYVCTQGHTVECSIIQGYVPVLCHDLLCGCTQKV